MKKLINMKSVGNFAKTGCKLVLYGMVYVLPYTSALEHVVDKVRYSGNVKYSDAVDVIMSSSMMSSDKKEVMKVLKKDLDTEVYKTVITVMKSNMMSSNKVEVIKNICEQ